MGSKPLSILLLMKLFSASFWKKGWWPLVTALTTALIVAIAGIFTVPTIAQNIGEFTPSKILPRPPQPFRGKIERTAKESTPDFPKPLAAPKNAPNILLILTDDVGFGASSPFGGPIATPTYEALAKRGLRFNTFHTTALCSPTRAALITGRNHHAVHSGVITEMGTGYPGYDTLMQKDTATVAEVLKQNGYNTAWFGKNHNVPDWQSSQAGPFDLWPTGLGFEYFFGFLGGDTDQWHPAAYEGTKPIQKPEDKSELHFDQWMANKAISYIQEQNALVVCQAKDCEFEGK
jgi:arylsulfatase